MNARGSLYIISGLLILLTSCDGTISLDNPSLVSLSLICEDQDGDNICDKFEGQEVDTDGDKIADYLDPDSDNDGISDKIEGGVALGVPPIDNDTDGIPNYRDLDSDNNGINDATEGTGDADQDKTLDFADLDDDNDYLLDEIEMGDDPAHPADTDQDQKPDFRDTDSDGDLILDADELDANFDGDGLPNFRDLDSDNDQIPDAIEAADEDPLSAPVDTDGDLSPDFVDLDADNDGLSDESEDLNHDGVLDPDETDPRQEDTDGDGVSDLIEVTAGSDARDPADNPRARGDFVFLEPFASPPDPKSDRLSFSTSFKEVDLYILEDVSGSMADEINSIKNSLSTMLNSIVCGPGMDPATDYCIPDVQTGAGQFGRSGQTWAHLKDINDNNLYSDPGPDKESTEALLPTTASGGMEQHIQAMAGAISGTCGSDPARQGKACFRQNALGLIILVSDEDFHEDQTYNARQTSYDAIADLGLRVIGVTGNDAEVGTLTGDMMSMSGGTPSEQLVPALADIPGTAQCQSLSKIPFAAGRAIISGPDSNAANAMTCAIQAVTAFMPQDVSTIMVNDPTNADAEGTPVDAIDAFVDHLEIYQDGSPECTDGHTVTDSDGDGHPDMYQGILPGAKVCWKLFVKQNDTVEPTPRTPQMFKATVQVHGEGGTLLDQRDVYFLVPPKIEGPILL